MKACTEREIGFVGDWTTFGQSRAALVWSKLHFPRVVEEKGLYTLGIGYLEDWTADR